MNRTEEVTFTHDGKEWRATRRSSIDPESGRPVYEQTLVDVASGEVVSRGSGLSEHTKDLTTSARESLEDIKVYHQSVERHRRKTEENLHRIYPELAQGAEVPNGPLPLIKLRFAQGLAFWGISLPEDAVVHRRKGSIHKAGWSVYYLFGSNERGEFLDYYASHRMTNDDHIRIYEDGTGESLPSRAEFRTVHPDPTEDARLAREFFEEQDRINEMIRTKFWSDEAEEG